MTIGWTIFAIVVCGAILLGINIVSSYLWWEVGVAMGRKEAEREHEQRELAKERRAAENAAREYRVAQDSAVREHKA